MAKRPSNPAPSPWRLVPPALLAGALVGLLGGYLLGRRVAGAAVPGSSANPGAPVGMDDQTARQMEAYRAEIARLQEAADASPEDPEPPLRIADMYFEVSLYDRAIPWYERALAIEDSPAVRNDLGFTRYLAGDAEAAIATLRALTWVFPEYARGWLALGVVLVHSEGDAQEAAAAFNQAIELDPQGEVGVEARRQLAGLGESA